MQTNRYVTVRDGLNYLEGSNWRESFDSIQLATNSSGFNGAAALRRSTKVYFSPTLGEDGPTIKLLTCSNVVLQLQPIALYLTDASGKSFLVGAARDEAESEIISPNVVVFRSAFKGIKWVPRRFQWKVD